MLSFDHHKPDYLAVNPNGTIPALRHGDTVLTDSTPTMEYIDTAFEGPALHPADAPGGWRMRMCFVDSYMGPALSMIGWSIGMGPSVRKKDPAELAALARHPGSWRSTPPEHHA